MTNQTLLKLENNGENLKENLNEFGNDQLIAFQEVNIKNRYL